jgi:hypothetical protein
MCTPHLNTHHTALCATRRFACRLHAGGLEFLRHKRPPHIMLEFSPGFRRQGSEDMLKTLTDLGYQAIEIWWDLAKMGQKVETVDLQRLAAQPIIPLASHKQREAFADKVAKVMNTNVWFALADAAADAHGRDGGKDGASSSDS